MRHCLNLYNCFTKAYEISGQLCQTAGKYQQQFEPASCSNVGNTYIQYTFVCLIDNVVNHFYPQAFVSRRSFQRFSVSCSSSPVIPYFVVFHKVPSKAASLNFTRAADIIGSQNFFCQQFQQNILNTFFSRSFNWYRKRYSISNLVTNFRLLLPFYLICW